MEKIASIFEDDLEKVYIVEFVQYTNATRDTVSISINNDNIYDTSFLKTPTPGLLIRESELDHYSKYGNGFDSIKLVGYMPKEKYDCYKYKQKGHTV